MGRFPYMLAVLGLAAAPQAMAYELTANAGIMSDYIFRGVKQNDAAAYGGIDWGYSGFYAGTWAAEVGEGLEYDLYAGYEGSVGDLVYGLGYTGYFYTDDFDDTYQEINFKLGYGLLTVEYALGEYDNFAGPKLDYGFLSGTLEYEGFYLTYGTFSKDIDGDYFEAGYGTEVAGFDLAVALVNSSKELAGGDSSETALMFTFGKTFDLR